MGVVLFATSFFDAHNHFTGILPFQAYANLSAYIASFSAPKRAVDYGDRLALYKYLVDTWYPSQGTQLDDKVFSPADGQRFALGARAALVVYRNQVAGSAAAVLELARTNIDSSEQSLPFVGGWRFDRGKSGALATIECVMHASYEPAVLSALHVMNKNMPAVKIVLMTHTAQLATLPGRALYCEWSKTGSCAAVALPRPLRTEPKGVYEALMGWSEGKPVVAPSDAPRYFDDVVGIDTAAPETTCFTAGGMEYYQRLIGAVYDAAKARRLAGWHGKAARAHARRGGRRDRLRAESAGAALDLPTHLFRAPPDAHERRAGADEYLDAVERDRRVRTAPSGRTCLRGLPARARHVGDARSSTSDARRGR